MIRFLKLPLFGPEVQPTPAGIQSRQPWSAGLWRCLACRARLTANKGKTCTRCLNRLAIPYLLPAV